MALDAIESGSEEEEEEEEEGEEGEDSEELEELRPLLRQRLHSSDEEVEETQYPG